MAFRFHDKNDYMFSIRKEDYHLEDAPLLYNGKPYLNTSSAFLLTELADWLSTKSNFAYSFKHDMISAKVKNLCEKLIREDEYFNKLRISEKNGVYIVIKHNEDYTIVAKDSISLVTVVIELGLTKTSSIETKDVDYDSTTILSGKIKDNILKGEYFFLSDFVPISVILEEEEPTKKNFDKVVKLWSNKIKKEISAERFDTIKRDTSKQIVEAALSQSDNISEVLMQESIEKLNKELKLKSIEYYDDSMSFVFSASNEFPENTIKCTLDKKLAIDDCIVE